MLKAYFSLFYVSIDLLYHINKPNTNPVNIKFVYPSIALSSLQ